MEWAAELSEVKQGLGETRLTLPCDPNPKSNQVKQGLGVTRLIFNTDRSEDGVQPRLVLPCPCPCPCPCTLLCTHNVLTVYLLCAGLILDYLLTALQVVVVVVVVVP